MNGMVDLGRTIEIVRGLSACIVFSPVRLVTKVGHMGNLILLASLMAPATGDPPEAKVYTPGMLMESALWDQPPDQALIAATTSGLRVEVSAGRTWSAATASNLVLPANTGRARVEVSDVTGGAWFVRLYGPLRGNHPPTTVELFGKLSAAGEKWIDIDYRHVKALGTFPLQIQLGIEGPPGSYATFSALEFLPRQTPPKRHDRKSIQQGQKDIECVEHMPNLPQPFQIKDWRALAQAYDRFVFDHDAKGEYLPLIWLDDSRVNIDRTTFGLYSYVGDKRQGPEKGGQESVTCIAAVVGATLAGIKKTAPPHDYVLMCEAWQNNKNSSRLVLDTMDFPTGNTFWYEIWPQILFAMLAEKYPGHGALDDISRTGAERWCEAVEALSGPDGIPDFNHTAFNFSTMTAVDNNKWREPDAAAGVAWLQYAAWTKYGDERFLKGTDACLRFLQEYDGNPYYEVLLPYGALVAARVNAEHGRNYDLDKFLNWCFGISTCRGGWGVIADTWGEYDCHGLVGSIDDGGGYAFAMNTFAQAAALTPLVRYDARYARAIGKWMLNLTNAARLFYSGALPDDHQTSAFWKGDPNHVIAYEGLRREWLGKSPCATGDPIAYKWGPETDLGLYGSSYVGFLGAIVNKTNDEKILQLDCLATDFYHDKAYPTWLYFNPHDQPAEVKIEIGPAPKDLYDAAAHVFVAENVQGTPHMTIPPDSAIVLVLVPSEGTRTREEKKLLVNGVVIDYAANKEII